MNIARNALLVLSAIVPLTLSAQTVYESTNEQGGVEFSDQPSSGSSAVTVNPNVVNIAPAPEIETNQRPAKQQAATKPAPAPKVEIQSTTVNNNNRLRRKRRARAR